MNKNQSIRDLIFDPILYVEYPYHWEEQNENGTTSIIFSKNPRYTFLEQIEIRERINKAINLLELKQLRYLNENDYSLNALDLEEIRDILKGDKS